MKQNRTVRQITWLVVLAVAGTCARAETGSASNGPSLAETGPRREPVARPPADAVDRAIHRGVEFLLDRRNKDGSWGSARNTKGLNIYAPVPGAHHAFRTAVTSLCISALITCGDGRREVLEAVDRGETWLLEHLPSLRRATPVAIYNNWGHAYAIQALVKMYHRKPNDHKRRRQIKRLIQEQVGMLGRYECVDGGWCYYDFNARTQKPSGDSLSFVTATTLVALYEAKQVGVEPPKKLVDRALASIRRQRKPDFSYCYSEDLKYWPMHPINRPGGSVGRSQVCNLAMYLWKDEKTTKAVMRTWLDRLFARNLWLDMGRKRPVPHESWFAVAGYFFYYGHYYAGLCIEQLDPADRARFQDHLAHVLLRLQEKDGSWWDFPLYDYHQQYGTAFALMSLARCRRAN